MCVCVCACVSVCRSVSLSLSLSLTRSYARALSLGGCIFLVSFSISPPPPPRALSDCLQMLQGVTPEAPDVLSAAGGQSPQTPPLSRVTLYLRDLALVWQTLDNGYDGYNGCPSPHGEGRCHGRGVGMAGHEGESIGEGGGGGGGGEREVGDGHGQASSVRADEIV